MKAIAHPDSHSPVQAPVDLERLIRLCPEDNEHQMKSENGTPLTIDTSSQAPAKVAGRPRTASRLTESICSQPIPAPSYSATTTVMHSEPSQNKSNAKPAEIGALLRRAYEFKGDAPEVKQLADDLQKAWEKLQAANTCEQEPRNTAAMLVLARQTMKQLVTTIHNMAVNPASDTKRKSGIALVLTRLRDLRDIVLTAVEELNSLPPEMLDQMKAESSVWPVNLTSAATTNQEQEKRFRELQKTKSTGVIKNHGFHDDECEHFDVARCLVQLVELSHSIRPSISVIHQFNQFSETAAAESDPVFVRHISQVTDAVGFAKGILCELGSVMGSKLSASTNQVTRWLFECGGVEETSKVRDHGWSTSIEILNWYAQNNLASPDLNLSKGLKTSREQYKKLTKSENARSVDQLARQILERIRKAYFSRSLP